MPPKRGSIARNTGPARRGKSKPRERGRSHTRILSDIREESQVPTDEQTGRSILEKHAPPGKKLRSNCKKRSLEEAGLEDYVATSPEAHGTNADRTIRATSSKRAKINDNGDSAVQYPTLTEASHSSVLAQRIASQGAPYIPTEALLAFAEWHQLDTTPDTLKLTLNLIDLTLQQANWHSGLSGMIQPAACFLVASLLTRRQNLVENIVAAVGDFEIGLEEVLAGYALLWEWNDNLLGVVGECGSLVESFPAPWELTGQETEEQPINEE